jgi:hypothetical protein
MAMFMRSIYRPVLLAVLAILLALATWIVVFQNSGPATRSEAEPESLAELDPGSTAAADAVIPDPSSLGGQTGSQRVELEDLASKSNALALLHIHIQDRDSQAQPGHMFVIRPRAESVDAEKVQLYQSWSALQENGALFTTDAQGDLKVKVPVGVPFRLESSIHYRENSYGSVVVPNLREGQVYPITMVIRPLNEPLFFGRVVRAGTNTGIPNALVRGNSVPTQSDEEGIFRIAGVREGQRLNIQARGYALAGILCQGASVSADLAQRIPLTPEAKVFGTAMKGLEPLEGAMVTFEVYEPDFWSTNRSVYGRKRMPAMVNQSGEYWLDGLWPDVDYQTRLSLSDSGPNASFTIRKIVRLQQGKSSRFDLQLDDLTTVRGKVTFTGGNVAIGAQVVVSDARSSAQEFSSGQILRGSWFLVNAVNSSITDENGEYSIPYLAPGRWIIGVHEGTGVLQPWETQAVVVDIAAGSNEVRVDHLLDVGRFIKGRVVDSLGKGVEVAQVYARTRDGGDTVRSKCINSQGEFALGPLSHEDYFVGVFSPFRLTGETAPDPIMVKAGTDGLVITTIPAAGIRIQVVDSSGAGVPATVTLVRQDTKRELVVRTSSSGLSLAHDCLPGRYDLTVLARDETSIARRSGIELVGGQIKDLGRVGLKPMAFVTFDVPVTDPDHLAGRFDLWLQLEGSFSQFYSVEANSHSGLRLPYGSYRVELKLGGRVLYSQVHVLAESYPNLILTPSF